MGESYGAGVSLALATLKSRVMQPDGSLIPWTSPDGTPIAIAAAAPFAGWSDLGYSLQLKRTDARLTEITSVDADLVPAGVQKQSINAGLYGAGALFGHYALLPAPTRTPTSSTGSRSSPPAGRTIRPSTGGSASSSRASARPTTLLAGATHGFDQVGRRRCSANGFTDDVFRRTRFFATTTSRARCIRPTRRGAALRRRPPTLQQQGGRRTVLRSRVKGSSSITTSRALGRSRRWA